jgi:hypothetical protein
LLLISRRSIRPKFVPWEAKEPNPDATLALQQ